MNISVEINKATDDYWWRYKVSQDGKCAASGDGYATETEAQADAAWSVYRIVNGGPSGELAFAIEESAKYRLDFMDLEVELAGIIEEAKKGLAANQRGESLKSIIDRLEKAIKKI